MPLKPFDYDAFAPHYDVLELRSSNEPYNAFLDELFQQYGVKTIADLTCGTGAQCIALALCGYRVSASDLSEGMLKIAREKARFLPIEFRQGDMRSLAFGTTDAAIASFNAIAHLARSEFEEALRNIALNLKKGGLFVFDVFNLDFMRSGGFIDHRFIDAALEHQGVKYVRFNHNRLREPEGVIEVRQELFIQPGFEEPEHISIEWDAQLYTSEQLRASLERNGFTVLEFFGGANVPFDREGSMFVHVLAQKR